MTDNTYTQRVHAKPLVLTLSLLLVVLLALPAGCSPTQAIMGAAPAFAAEISEAPAQGSSSNALHLKGHIVPGDYVSLAPASAGTIDGLYVEEGDRVLAGDLLARMSGYEATLAERDAAELAIIRSRQAIENLNTEAGLEAAKKLVELRGIEDDLAMARSRYKSLSRGPSEQRIQQVHANLLLAEKGWELAREELERAQKKYANKLSLIWKFVHRGRFRLQITMLESQVADAERRYWDAKEKYEDILEPPDPIDLAVAATQVNSLEHELAQARLDYDELSAGPDADTLEMEMARLRAAEARRAAAGEALHELEIHAPIDGVVVQITKLEGEWASNKAALLTVAGLDSWKIEAVELEESDLPRLEAGEKLRITLDAYPGLELTARLDSTSLYAREDDDQVYYKATFELLDPPQDLRWGMTARIEIE